MNNRFAIILVALTLVFGGLLYLNKKEDAGSNNQTAAQASNNTKGEGAKNVTLVEYGDFECPACGAFHPLVKQVYEKYKADITFQFVNFPIISIHPNAMTAHRAAEAAGKQGKFWEMHDLLYEQQAAWRSQATSNPIPIFEGFAQELKLDMAKYRDDVAASEINSIITADLKKGNQLKVTSTPTFFLDGKKIDQNPQDLEGFSRLIDAAIASKSQQN